MRPERGSSGCEAGLREGVTAPQTRFPGGNSELAPPDPIPNSEVKRLSADGSVGSPHVRVGHCQDLTPKIPGP